MPVSDKLVHPPPLVPSARPSSCLSESETPLSIPCHAAPFQCGLNRHRLHHSLVAQMDGLMDSFFRIRVERDVFAPSLAASHSVFYGVSPFVAWSTFVGLYYGDFEVLPEVVATAITHQCIGLFIVPVWPDHGRRILWKGKELSWYNLLLAHSLLQFHVKDPIVIDSNGRPRASQLAFGLTGIVASFNWAGKLKSKRRPERHLDVRPLPVPADDGSSKIGVTPFVVTRVSPLADSMTPTRDMDTAKATPSLPMSDLLTELPPTKQGLNRSAFDECASVYPFPDVASLAVQVVGDGLDLEFMGDDQKAVMRPNSRSIQGHELEIRNRCAEECSVYPQRMLGPFTSCPFPSVVCNKQPRSVPLSQAKKHKWIALCSLFRLISNFSAGQMSSTNELFWRPALISSHTSPRHIADRIASCGDGVRGWAADIPKCFRNQKNRDSLLHLFVYVISTEEFGTEYFVDRMNPFGWRPSEWGWQCVLNVVLFFLHSRGLCDVLGYVDNFFRFSPKGHDHPARVAECMTVFDSLGIKFHEVQGPDYIEGLGWGWDLKAMEMVCSPDKLDVILEWLHRWSTATNVSLFEVRRLVGLMNWVVAGFPVGKADVAPLVHMRTKGDRIAKNHPRLKVEDIKLPFSARAKESVSFWLSTLSRWNGRCPIALDFGPVATWQKLGRVDASTDWGCGGFLVDGEEVLAFVHPWTPEERSAAFVKERMSTGALELLGAKYWFAYFGRRCADSRVQLEMDNRSATDGIQSGYSDKPFLLDSIRSVRVVCAELRINLRVCHILGVLFNQIADALSHNQVGVASDYAWTEFQRRLVLLPSSAMSCLD